MSVAEEIAKLQQLHQSGGLTDDEFAKAKAAVLQGKPIGAATPNSSPTAQSWAKKVPWGWVVLVVIAIIAFVTNPDEAKHNQEMASKDQRGFLAKAAGAALADVSFERSNYVLFSTGKLKIRLRLTRQEGYVVVVGAFGRWWYDWPVSTNKI